LPLQELAELLDSLIHVAHAKGLERGAIACGPVPCAHAKPAEALAPTKKEIVLRGAALPVRTATSS
jgi:hypothetical protein